jgi:Galactosyltransferase
MRCLIGIVSCHALLQRADACRETWIPLVRGADVRFFLGRGYWVDEDEVFLNVADNYASLPNKVQAMYAWALQHGYDYVCKIDDDVYCRPERLLASDFQHDYVGPLSRGSTKIPYASGFAHWVSRRSMEIITKAEIDDWAEDRWTGKVLHEAGIALHVDDRYQLIRVSNGRNLPLTGTDGPLASNDVIAVGELEPAHMRLVHEKLERSLYREVS